MPPRRICIPTAVAGSNVEGSSVTSPTTNAADAGVFPARPVHESPHYSSEDAPERAPSFDEMLDGCILRLIHKLPPTGLAPRRNGR
jgi:hypothetical protein